MPILFTSPTITEVINFKYNINFRIFLIKIILIIIINFEDQPHNTKIMKDKYSY